MVYLLHFSRAFKHALHFIGATVDADDARLIAKGEVPIRLQSPLIAAARGEGITFTVARTWTGDVKTARRLRERGGHRHLCHICAVQRAEHRR